MHPGFRLLLSVVVACLCGLVSQAQTLDAKRVVNGLTRPVLVTHAPGDSNRLYILEKSGRIRVFRTDTHSMNVSDFLNITSLINSSGERGLLGLAFDPAFSENSLFYVYYISATVNNPTIIARYTALNADTANIASAVILKTIAQPAGVSNHKGGMIAFSPVDGMLYCGLGDGGDANDPNNRAQNDGDLLGKMIRLDVNNPPDYIPADNPYVGAGNPLDEIWSKGLRNPWRWSFDRLNGDLYIGDVGQGAVEEVDYRPAASTGGENYGWRCMEGNNCTGLSGCTCDSPELTYPVHTYTHSLGVAVTGGYVYRGCAIPELYGHYLFADWGSNRIWTFRYDGSTVQDYTERTTDLADLPADSGWSITGISAFGEDAAGELYIVDYNGGEIFKVIPEILPDCNHNGIRDSCDIVANPALDLNSNGIIDSCECFAEIAEDLVILPTENAVILAWTAVGNGNETYSVYRCCGAMEPFPGANWQSVASMIPSTPGAGAIVFSDPIVDPGTICYYLVTSVCP